KAEQGELAGRLERAEIALRGQRAGAEQAGARGAGKDASQRESDRPELDVVRLGPGQDPDDPDADTPRPVLRASGNSGVIQERRAGKILMDDRKDSPEPTKKKPLAGSTAKSFAKPAGEKKNP